VQCVLESHQLEDLHQKLAEAFTPDFLTQLYLIAAHTAPHNNTNLRTTMNNNFLMFYV